jgi:drug/metabolite transporter (DMT)-like permease
LSAQALPYVILLGFLFGSTLIASRFSVGQFNPLTYIGLRLVIASLCHLTVYALSDSRHVSKNRLLWRRSAVLGVFGTAIPMTFIVSSLQFQSAGITAALLTTGPALTVLLAHFFLPDEKMTRRKALGVILALSGALLLTLLGETGLPDVDQANPIGYVLVFIAMISASSATIYARKYLREFDAFDVASARMGIAALVVMPLSLLLVGFDLSAVTVQGYLALGYASLIGTFSGMMLAFYIIKRFGATTFAMTSFVIPVVATLGGVLILGEQITVGMMTGMLLIIAGITIINQRARPIQTRASTTLP